LQRHFRHDDLDRLTKATIDGASQSYSYDAFGNLTGIVTGGSNKNIPTDPSSNRMIGQTYDAAGNLTSRKDQGTYVYDALNVLVEYGAVPNIDRRRSCIDGRRAHRGAQRPHRPGTAGRPAASTARSCASLPHGVLTGLPNGYGSRTTSEAKASSSPARLLNFTI
jgi:YD repeat-containing protein